MAQVTSRQTLKEYCLRRLGAPVMQINVDDTQLEDRIDDAIEMFWTFHGDGVDKSYYAHPVTALDITNKYLTLPNDVRAVVKIIPYNSSSFATSNIEFQYYMTEIINIAKMSTANIGGFMISQQYVSTMNEIFNREEIIRFNNNSGRLHIDQDWAIMKEGMYVLVECYTRVDPEQFTRMYNDLWLKDYVTSLFKKQWGMNLIKYDGFQLPSGIVLNGRQIYDDAVAEITILEEQLNNMFQLPVDFMVG